MPELPEVENIKLGLEDSLKNKKILKNPRSYLGQFLSLIHI